MSFCQKLLSISDHLLLLLAQVILPTFVGLVVASRVSATSYVSSDPEALNTAVPLFQLYNFWSIVIGAYPLHATAFSWMAIESIKRVVAKVDLTSPSAHLELVKYGSHYWWAEIVASVLLFLAIGLMLQFAFMQGYVKIVSDDFVNVKLSAIIAWTIALLAFIILPFIRSFRITLLRKEGVAIEAYIEPYKQRLRALFGVAGFCLIYVTNHAINAPPVSVTAADGTKEPCAIVRNETYNHLNCVPDPLAVGGYKCDDGGYHEYRSAEDACVAAVEFFSLVVHNYSAFILHLSLLTFGILLPLQWKSLSAASKLPCMRKLSMAIFVVTGFVCLAVPVSVALGPYPLNDNNTMAQFMYYLWVIIIWVLGVGLASALLNIELIVERRSGLATGGDLPVTFEDGKTSTIREVIERVLERDDRTGAGVPHPRLVQAPGMPRLSFGARLLRAMLGRQQPRVGGTSTSPYASASESGASESHKFSPQVNDLIMGRAKDAANGINWYMGVGKHFAMPSIENGVAAIEKEIRATGGRVLIAPGVMRPEAERAEDVANLEYILSAAAGSSETAFENGGLKRDCGRDGKGERNPLMHDSCNARARHLLTNGSAFDSRFSAVLDCRKLPDGSGMKFEDFVDQAKLKTGGETSPIHEPHILALRLYTTSSFKRINQPLRNRVQHPFPITVNYITEGIGLLRAAEEVGGNRSFDLFRGMKDVACPEDFMQLGGTDAAPMSTTTDLKVAIEYSKSASSLLFKIATKSFLERGADLSFLSAFPGEAEYLLPPLTCLRPTKRTQKVTVQTAPGKTSTYTVVEVEPLK